MGAKKTVENCHSYAFDPQFGGEERKRWTGPPSFCRTSVTGFGSKDGARPRLPRVGITWEQKWNAFRALPRGGSGPGA